MTTMEIFKLDPFCRDGTLQDLFKFIDAENIYWEWSVEQPCKLLVLKKDIGKLNEFLKQCEE